jgi:hypothetical protein
MGTIHFEHRAAPLETVKSPYHLTQHTNLPQRINNQYSIIAWYL